VVEEATDPTPIEPEEPVMEGGSLATVGDTVQVGAWSVTVTEFAKNANQVIAANDEYNEKPKHQYMLVSYEAVYSGAERTADVMLDLTWSLTGNNAKVLDPTTSQMTPADSNQEDWITEVRSGGTAEWQVLFDMDPALLDDGILTVEGTDEETWETVYADFGV
jgi:hypothetical protein